VGRGAPQLQGVISGTRSPVAAALAWSHPREGVVATVAETTLLGRIASSYPAANSMTPVALIRK
jgi:hypothetical protein